MEKIIIVAKSDNNAIGGSNDLLWHLPADLEYFERTIKGHWLITGRKSFETAQGSEIFAAPEKTIIITRNPMYKAGAATVVNSVPAAFEAAKAAKVERLYILGGGEIYKQSMDYADILLITEIHATFENADTFFPAIDPAIWQETSRVDHVKDAENSYDYSFVRYERNTFASGDANKPGAWRGA